ncbi:hypothetical protein BD309DRAFT_917299 [Dichomitus squalens]|nr:hypothetical protein BD309DRAFT_917299 [Dichomitus squalens]
MELSPGFRRVRTGVFALTTFVSVLWVVLLSVEIFVLYDRSDAAQRNLVAILIFTNAITAIMLPVLSIFQFRAWLDAARLLFLLMIHIGTALLFTIWNATFQCPADASQRRDCRSVNIAIVACAWVVPFLLIWYAAFLAVTYRMWHNDRKKPDEELSEKRLSELPMMLPSSRRPSLGPEMQLSSNASNVLPASRKPPPPPLQRPPHPLPLPPAHTFHSNAIISVKSAVV